MNSRRQFLAGSILTSAAVIINGTTSAAIAQSADGQTAEYTLPPLPYPASALEPYIDEETMNIHHSKHHLAYVNGLIKAESELREARRTGNYTLIQHWLRQRAFHGGGHALHSMFWTIMAPPGSGGGGRPSGSLERLIVRDFGSFDVFKDQFSAAAVAVEGSGWALLHYEHSTGTLVVLQAENQQKLSAWNTVPIMGIDVWEHAYYLRYRNNRAEYVKNWWNVVNWEQVQSNLTRAMAVR